MDPSYLKLCKAVAMSTRLILQGCLESLVWLTMSFSQGTQATSERHACGRLCRMLSSWSCLHCLPFLGFIGSSSPLLPILSLDTAQQHAHSKHRVSGLNQARLASLKQCDS